MTGVILTVCGVQAGITPHFSVYSFTFDRGWRETDLPERAPGRVDVVLLQGPDHPLCGVELDQAR